MNCRLYFGVFFLSMIVLVLIAQTAKLIWPPQDEVIYVDGGGLAYAAQFKPRAKPIVIRPAPRPKRVPGQHRIKGNNEPFNRFEFDQRTIV